MKAIHNFPASRPQRLALLSITKLQNLKAIHNGNLQQWGAIGVVINHKITKFESNSQHKLLYDFQRERCYQSQNYKIWKQFTTLFGVAVVGVGLLSITKLQNLKAIHNENAYPLGLSAVVINHKTTKFESNSQQWEHK